MSILLLHTYVIIFNYAVLLTPSVVKQLELPQGPNINYIISHQVIASTGMIRTLLIFIEIINYFKLGKFLYIDLKKTLKEYVVI